MMNKEFAPGEYKNILKKTIAGILEGQKNYNDGFVTVRPFLGYESKEMDKLQEVYDQL